jgi:hypothetical protein
MGNDMSGCAKWFLILLVLCLFFGIGQVFATIFSLIGGLALGIIILALIIN